MHNKKGRAFCNWECSSRHYNTGKAFIVSFKVWCIWARSLSAFHLLILELRILYVYIIIWFVSHNIGSLFMHMISDLALVLSNIVKYSTVAEDKRGFVKKAALLNWKCCFLCGWLILCMILLLHFKVKVGKSACQAAVLLLMVCILAVVCLLYY